MGFWSLAFVDSFRLADNLTRTLAFRFGDPCAGDRFNRFRVGAIHLRNIQLRPDWIPKLLKFGPFGFGLAQDGNISIGIFP
jgi:hypothetical protein